MTDDDLLKLQQVETAYKEAKAELEKVHPRQVISEVTYHDFSLKYGSLIQVGIGAEAI